MTQISIGKLSFETKKRLFKCDVIPILLYGSNFWTISSEENWNKRLMVLQKDAENTKNWICKNRENFKNNKYEEEDCVAPNYKLERTFSI